MENKNKTNIEREGLDLNESLGMHMSRYITEQAAEIRKKKLEEDYPLRNMCPEFNHAIYTAYIEEAEKLYDSVTLGAQYSDKRMVGYVVHGRDESRFPGRIYLANISLSSEFIIVDGSESNAMVAAERVRERSGGIVKILERL